jgi:hypothetical protein
LSVAVKKGAKVADPERRVRRPLNGGTEGARGVEDVSEMSWSQEERRRLEGPPERKREFLSEA